ncbi:MAG: serine/threonine protein kinase [Deltaproteobacteria bacterium]|nr:serine/threonine protein kinase [Deltaproteobacteria bacterium]
MLTFPQKRGEFTLLRKIGEGGMAEVFLAEREGDEDFKTLVALKRLHGGFALDQYFIRQLVQEAKLLGQLQHTNIVRVNDLRRIDDDYYIVMEYIDGIDVAQAIQVHRDHDLRFPLSIFFHIALSLCEALDFAHSATDMDGKPIRLIHRDIKPSNVLISNRGIVKLTDFGIARVGDTSNTGSVVKGTANYMSPEQASGEQNLTPASDIFSLGAVFWEMLTLEKLVDGTNYLTVINSIKDLNVGLKDITKKGIEPGLRMILLRMLARKRELRYQSMGLVLKDLRFVAEQMKVDLSPSHLREYMAKITQLARDAAGRLSEGTNLATANVDEPDEPVDLPDAAPPEPASTVEETPAQEVAFAESVAALKALVLKDTESKKNLKAAPPPPVSLTNMAKTEPGNAPTAPPQPPLPRTPTQAKTVSDDVAAPPSATGLQARAELAAASQSPAARATNPGAPAPKGKRSRRQKKRDKAKAAAAAAAGAAGAAGANVAATASMAASKPTIPPAGVPTPPIKPKPVAAPPPPPVAAAPPPPKPAPVQAAPVARAANSSPEPVMMDVDGADDGYDDGYDDWDEGGSNMAVYVAVAVVVLLLGAVVWLMLPGSDPGGDAIATGDLETGAEPLAGQDAASTEEADAKAQDSASAEGASESEASGDSGDAVADAGSDAEAAAPTPERDPDPTPAAVASSRSNTSDRSSSGSRSSDSRASASSSRSSTSNTGGASARSSSSSARASDSRSSSSSARDTTSRSSSRDTGSSSSRSASSDSGSSSRAAEPRYTGGSSSSSGSSGSSGSSRSSGSSPRSDATASSSSDSGSSSSDDWDTASSDVRSPYGDEDSGSSDSATSDDAVAMVDAPSAQQVIDDYSDAARRGRLEADAIEQLEAIAPSASSYENSRAVLLAQFEATGDGAKHCDLAGEVLGQPGNYADPQWNLEMSKCHLRQGRYEDALETSRVAELHAQDIPARSRTDRQLKIWEIQAKSYKGLYQGTENLDYLSDAIAVWKRYRHMANNTYRPREATRAEDAIAALQDLSEGAL